MVRRRGSTGGSPMDEQRGTTEQRVTTDQRGMTEQSPFRAFGSPRGAAAHDVEPLPTPTLATALSPRGARAVARVGVGRGSTSCAAAPLGEPNARKGLCSVIPRWSVVTACSVVPRCSSIGDPPVDPRLLTIHPVLRSRLFTYHDNCSE